MALSALVGFASLLPPLALAQSSQPVTPAAATAGAGQSAAPGAPASSNAPAPPKPAAAKPAMRAEAMRNENVAVNPIDNNAIKEANVRTGTTTTLILELRPDVNYVAAHHGRPTATLGLLGSGNPPAAWHGEAFWNHQNSIFNARSFFQFGPVKPSRRNNYGFRASGPLSPARGKRTWLTLTGNQGKIRGMVNGNILVPLADERTPTATDPATRALVTRFLSAYPNELPNRPDFDRRALNTNAPQRIDEVDGTARLDHDLGRLGRLTLQHNLTRQATDAFQLVAGQNPDSNIHTHRTQLSWRYSPSANTTLTSGFTFQRARTVFVAEPNAAPVRVRMGFQIEELGPEGEFPVDRALNSFRYTAQLAKRLAGGRHELSLGGQLARQQHNGIETSNSRGFFAYSNAFGRTAIENFLLGTPSSYEVSVGEFARGFRRWTADLFAGDNWRLHRRLQIQAGLRWNLVTAPTEVNGLHPRPYGCDCNNLAPRFGFSLLAGRGWVLRGASHISFIEIPPVTYQQIRYNLPYVASLLLQQPALVNPLGAAGLQSSGGLSRFRQSPTYLSPDLVSPYDMLASLSAERRLARVVTLRLGYLGSRTVKNLNAYVFNRAVPVPGVPMTLETVDARRPDPRYSETKWIVNGGNASFQAAQASLDLSSWRGLRASAAYTFSKAIDDGVDFTATAANRDLNRARAQLQFDSFADRRGLSNFDSPHALVTNYSYDLPSLRGGSWLAKASRNWQIAGVVLAKSGTPFTLFSGSDAPGFGNVDGTTGDRPSIIDPSILGRTIGDPDTAPLILSRDKFRFPTVEEGRGNLGRNTLRKARIANWNAAVTKTFRFAWWGENSLQVRAEAYNLSNTPQFDEANRNLTSPAFGKITNTLNDGRALQFSLRLNL